MRHARRRTISNELRRAYIRVALWWDNILDPTPDWPLITGEAETRMHVHDAKMENLIGHDKDLHISLLLGDVLVGRSLTTVRAGPHLESDEGAG